MSCLPTATIRKDSASTEPTANRRVSSGQIQGSKVGFLQPDSKHTSTHWEYECGAKTRSYRRVGKSTGCLRNHNGMTQCIRATFVPTLSADIRYNKMQLELQAEVIRLDNLSTIFASKVLLDCR